MPTVRLHTVKMVSFMFCIFYHSQKVRNKNAYITDNNRFACWDLLRGATQGCSHSVGGTEVDESSWRGFGAGDGYIVTRVHPFRELF